ncbi:HD domain-containing protein [Phormidium sp. LEGE 05292]|uniref:HD domain-containing protein n=1 Tax=[Phormidium] sp. LEGE 05292 TaxID=767427 RepID=UPI00187FF188|nr:HD domain-containing protein [Phormidium sp. LEGE 05292]MBE9223986.1 HD domain-containing protein [Phormidium sp. LEGE 05292]
MNDRLTQQIQFIIEIDKLKNILRQTKLTNGSRQENSAEHSWHIAIMAIILAEYAEPEVDIIKAIKMLLIHDLIEIDAGDTFCYDVKGNLDKAEREIKAATRIFGLLPSEQAEELRQLWEEFEESKTETAKFAIALDRLQPLLQNQQNYGGTWQTHGITENLVRKRMSPVQEASPILGKLVEEIIADCIAAGYLKKEPLAELIPDKL